MASDATRDSHENRLARETSPYLLQHARNPVDWYPWGPEALARAQREDKPIFLSIGYSACHWCHVMERECFENPQIAELMNTRYVNIKVDREERPDIDDIYMKAVVAMTGSGGWPMSVFLTPKLEPFFGTTYLPPVRAYGRPSFPDVLTALSEAWSTQREQVFEQAAQLTAAVVAEPDLAAAGQPDAQLLDQSFAALSRSFDAQWGGFGGAPKFPHAGDLRLLLRHTLRTGDDAAQAMALHTLDRMADGGMYDQLGGGFHRYSVDGQWRVPHFEKMLYDNAQLALAYVEAYTATGRERYAKVVRACCDWALREMQTPSGGFASAQDADSEGEEGRFFVWTRAELDEILGLAPGAQVAAWFDVTAEGNFEHGKNVLWLPVSRQDVAQTLSVPLPQLTAAVEAALPELLAARNKRVRPATDDKILASWNGLLITALAQAHQVLDEPRYLHAAERAMRFVLSDMRQADGRLFATARRGRAHVNACLDDYTFITQALIDLYETTFDEAWLREALVLTNLVETGFADRERGGYFTTGTGHEPLIARLKSLHDGALPSGAAVHTLNLLRLSELTMRDELRERAQAALQALGTIAARQPRACSQLLIALDFVLSPAREIVIAGERGDPGTAALLRSVRSVFAPQRVLALATPDTDPQLLPLTRDKTPAGHGARAYVCEGFSCKMPAESPAQLVEQLSARRART